MYIIEKGELCFLQKKANSTLKRACFCYHRQLEYNVSDARRPSLTSFQEDLT